MYVNYVEIIGRVTRQPELKVIKGGQSLTSFSLATNRTYKNKDGEKVEESDFHNVIFWGKVAETICTYVKQGQCIRITGRLRTRKWEDKDGSTRYVTEIVGENFQFGEQARSAEAPEVKESTSSAKKKKKDGLGDDLPFDDDDAETPIDDIAEGL